MAKNPKDESNFFLDITGSWITPFLFGGFKKSLKEKDIPSPYSKIGTSKCKKEFQNLLSKGGVKITTLKLVKTILLLSWKELLFSQIFHFILLCLFQIYPYVQQLIIIHSQQSQLPPEQQTTWLISQYTGISLAAIFSFLLLLITFVTKIRSEMSGKVLLKLQSSLYGMLFENMIKMPSRAFDIGLESSSFITLLSFEIQNIAYLPSVIHFVWETPLLMVSSVILLFFNLQWSSFVLLAALCIVFPIVIIFSIFLMKFFEENLTLVNENAGKISEYFTAIKTIKFNHWESYIIQKLLQHRKKIIIKVVRYIFLLFTSEAFQKLVPLLFQISVLLTSYFTNRNTFTIERVVPSLTYINLFAVSFLQFPRYLQQVYQSVISIKKLSNIMNISYKYIRNKKVELQQRKINNESKYTIIMKNVSYKRTKKVRKKSTYKINNKNSEEIITKVLSNVNFKAKKGEIIAIIGEVGSGKTSFLLSMLGELERTNGTSYINGNIAYCSQQPWLFHTTIEKNITFNMPLCPIKFKRVIFLCGLQKDLKTFPSGIDTIVGERGLTLSEGQKQRIAIARSLYALEKSHIFLFDDIFSSIDSGLASHIFSHGVLQYLKKWNKTVVLVTNKIDFLKHCDKIIIMEDMKIIDVGRFDLLIHKNEYLKHMVKKFSSKKTFPKPKQMDFEVIEISPSHETKTGKKTPKTQKNKKIEKIVKESEIGSGYIKISTIAYFLRFFGLFNDLFTSLFVIFIFISISTLGVIHLIFPSIWLSFWTTKYLPNVSESTYLFVYILNAIMIPITFLIKHILYSLCTWIIGIKMYKKLIIRIYSSPMIFFQKILIGTILNLISTDVVSFDYIIFLYDQLYCSFLTTILSFIIIGITNYLCIIPVLLLLPIYIIVQEFYRKTSRELNRIERAMLSPIISFFQETFKGIKTIKAFKAENTFIYKNVKKVNKAMTCRFLNYHISIWLTFRLGLISFAIVSIQSFLLIYFANNNYFGMTLFLGISMTHSLMISMRLSLLMSQIVYIEQQMIGIERIKYYSNVIESEINEKEKVIPSMQMVLKNDFKEVKFKNVSLRYRENLPLAIKNISVKFTSKEKVCIVGRSGSGKTTLVDVLMRTHPLEHGEVSINGININSIRLSNLRKSITNVSQNSFLFQGSLRSNMDPLNEYCDDECWSVLNKVNMKEFVIGMKGKLNMRIEKGGKNLSSGQRQLIFIGRALLRKSKLLIFDEATSSVDLNTTKMILELIFKEFKDSIVLVIAHRLNFCSMYDRLIVIEHGKIVDDGRPKKLMGKKRGGFRRLLNETK